MCICMHAQTCKRGAGASLERFCLAALEKNREGKPGRISHVIGGTVVTACRAS